MKYTMKINPLLVLVLFFISSGCTKAHIEHYKINNNAQGSLELVDNIQNLTVVSNDENVFKAEYYAGYIQGKLQAGQIRNARDNQWNNYYLLINPNSPTNVAPKDNDMSYAQDKLIQNYMYLCWYMKNPTSKFGPVDPEFLKNVSKNINRILYRMLGIYHGTNLMAFLQNFQVDWSKYFKPKEMILNYEKTYVSFLDIYFLNAFADLLDVLDSRSSKSRFEKCSAFVKRTSSDIIIAHNSWYLYLSQTMAMSFYINDTFFTINSMFPGLVGSLTDFGYNKNGLLFCETTHGSKYTEVKVKSLWAFIRATMAEQFSANIDDFYKYLALDLSGTYMNGYMVVDSKTKALGLIEMSYKTLVYFKSNPRGGYIIKTKPEGLKTDYDKGLLNGNYILGINYPVSIKIREDLQSIENRPARRTQFYDMIGDVQTIEKAKDLITYTDPKNPLSIYGRWDCGYGQTPTPKIVAEGSVDAKVVSVNDIQYIFKLKGKYNKDSKNKSIYMKFGTPIVDENPFIWSASKWKGYKLRNVADVLSGSFHYLDLHID